MPNYQRMVEHYPDAKLREILDAARRAVVTAPPDSRRVLWLRALEAEQARRTERPQSPPMDRAQLETAIVTIMADLERLRRAIIFRESVGGSPSHQIDKIRIRVNELQEMIDG